MQNAIGPALVMLAAFLWGISGGLAGLLMDHDWSPAVVTFYRGAVGLVCLLIGWLPHTVRHVRHINRRLLAWAVLAGLGVAGNLTFYAIAIDRTSVAIAATLMYTAPVHVFAVACLTGNERPTLGKGLAIALVMIGIVLLTDVLGGGGQAVTLVGVAAGLASALSYALFIFAFQRSAAHGAMTSTLIIAFAVFSIVLGLIMNRGEAVQALYSSDLQLFLLLGLLGAGLSFAVYLPGLRRTPATIASIVAMIEPVTAALFGLLVLGESLDLGQAAGLALIVITVTVLSARRP